MEPQNPNEAPGTPIVAGIVVHQAAAICSGFSSVWSVVGLGSHHGINGGEGAGAAGTSLRRTGFVKETWGADVEVGQSWWV